MHYCGMSKNCSNQPHCFRVMLDVFLSCAGKLCPVVAFGFKKFDLCQLSLICSSLASPKRLHKYIVCCKNPIVWGKHSISNWWSLIFNPSMLIMYSVKSFKSWCWCNRFTLLVNECFVTSGNFVPFIVCTLIVYISNREYEQVYKLVKHQYKELERDNVIKLVNISSMQIIFNFLFFLFVPKITTPL